MQLINGLRFDNIKGDIYGGLTAAVVALPLALAFGVASGAGPIAGLWGAIFVGLFAALFGGTPCQVSGPTGPMTVVMTAIIVEYAHEPALAFTIVIMGGALQIVFGLLRLGRYVAFVPFPVISGFMSGIGCIIIILQLGPFMGFPSSQSGIWTALVELPGQALNLHPEALIAGLIALAIVLFMPRRLREWAPPALVALIAGTLIALLWLPSAPVIGEIPRGLPRPMLPAFALTALPGMIKSAFVLALLGSIDSLMTSLIADNVTRGQHKSDRELIGQGIGNMAAGLFGGIPGAGATMRTVINARAGGRTPISGALHALVLLALVLGLAPLAEVIPHAVLAGILLTVGWGIIDWDYLRRLRHANRAGVIVMLVVLLLTVLVDLIMAVAVGIIIKSLISASEIAQHQARRARAISDDDDATYFSDRERALLKESNGGILLMHFAGPFSFASAKELGRSMSNLHGGHQVVVFDFTDVEMVDTSIAMTVDDLIAIAAKYTEHVLISGTNSQAARRMAAMKAFDHVALENQFEARETALRRALELYRQAEDGGKTDTLSA